MKERILSAFLAFCVLLALFPFSVMALHTPPENAVLNEMPDSGADTPEPDDATLQAANISWPVEGGRLLFDGSTGTITGYTGELTDLEIPSEIYGVAVTTIGSGAFEHCSTLTSVTIPDSVTRIENATEEGYSYWGDAYHCYHGAFSGCANLTSVTIPDTVTYIGTGCFKGCSSLATIALPKKIDGISNALFMDCVALTDIEIPEGVTYIGTHAFDNCVKLSNVDLPNGFTGFGDSAFYKCESLTSVVIPDGVTTITGGGVEDHYGAFQGCTNLATLTIPESVTSIGYMAFSDCPIRNIYYYGSIAQWLKISVAEGNDSLATAELHFLTPSYTITFHPNGGEVSPTIKTLTPNDTVYGELPTPTRDGYAFEGWHTATEYGTRIEADTEFVDKRSQTLYAVWSEIKETYEVTLEGNGGSVTPSSVTVEAGGVYGELPEPSRDGCAFLGWFTEPSGGTRITAETQVRLTANQTLYAHWVATNAPEFSSNGAAVTDVLDMPAETDLEGKFTVADAENPDAFRTATAFCVLYDSDGLMVHLQSWEVDVSDTRNIRFTGSVRIPEGTQVSEIKIIVLSDELVPLQAAGTL